MQTTNHGIAYHNERKASFLSAASSLSLASRSGQGSAAARPRPPRIAATAASEDDPYDMDHSHHHHHQHHNNTINDDNHSNAATNNTHTHLAPSSHISFSSSFDPRRTRQTYTETPSPRRSSAPSSAWDKASPRQGSALVRKPTYVRSSNPSPTRKLFKPHDSTLARLSTLRLASDALGKHSATASPQQSQSPGATWNHTQKHGRLSRNLIRSMRMTQISHGRGGLITKHGQTRMFEHVSGLQAWLANFKDMYNFLVNLPSATLVGLFSLFYTCSFLLFGLFWYLLFRSDARCLAEVDDFATAFLFSVETQTTIGYGSKHVRGECEAGIFLLLVQVVMGKLMDAVLLGLITARLTRPDNRVYTLRCSKHAVVAKRDGKQYLMIRIGDMRQRRAPLVNCEVKLLLVMDHITEEGEHIPFYTQRLVVDSGSNSNTPFLAVPNELLHLIDESSPLFGMTPGALRRRHAEIVLILGGQIASLGLNVELRSSYLPPEIKFGHRFQQICCRLADGSCFTDWSHFDSLVIDEDEVYGIATHKYDDDDDEDDGGGEGDSDDERGNGMMFVPQAGDDKAVLGKKRHRWARFGRQQWRKHDADDEVEKWNTSGSDEGVVASRRRGEGEGGDDSRNDSGTHTSSNENSKPRHDRKKSLKGRGRVSTHRRSSSLVAPAMSATTAVNPRSPSSSSRAADATSILAEAAVTSQTPPNAASQPTTAPTPGRGGALVTSGMGQHATVLPGAVPRASDDWPSSSEDEHGGHGVHRGSVSRSCMRASQQAALSQSTGGTQADLSQHTSGIALRAYDVGLVERTMETKLGPEDRDRIASISRHASMASSHKNVSISSS
ncbi:G-protein-coupled inward rectifier potassium channel [Salpingoeca rosetta]|uniref:G-protein-coupled inward rectifier potassium channel n=1 Tax=Salpingoeca rosetta (strain ATCC 50818 / BSB-021) TaxID=946362 RepID=F2U026_SALR5|nr:G-protein-coupled inward rectifier potassium channel [Salpingoeca rosetta]EGD80754.1 G-protein-coupled inward rectifier potassium channel [Salpingoeca rosetta]|eukprot:XP_004997315.1 G-protein-coupled inward rectifier potassium channel [Salpingoeca rosetta]